MEEVLLCLDERGVPYVCDDLLLALPSSTESLDVLNDLLEMYFQTVKLSLEERRLSRVWEYGATRTGCRYRAEKHGENEEK